MAQPDDLLAADTSELTMLGRGVERAEGQRPGLECFTTRIPLTSETHRTGEWVSLSPMPPHRPDIYQVAIVYAPRAGRVLEAKSLREYGLSWKTTAADAHTLARQVAHEALAATHALWVEVTFRNTGSGEGARTTLRASDDLVQAATAEPTLGRLVDHAEGQRPRLACVTAEVAASGQGQTHQWRHESHSWVSQSPVPPYLPDIYHVTIAYAPCGGRVLEAASLREYGASFSGTNAFAEALAGQVAYDVLAATGAAWVEVTFLQNVRGGWQIEALQRLTSGEPEPKQPQ
jgi:NADPH-dependent 7-cyano-7-deazaguanine reductase QueF